MPREAALGGDVDHALVEFQGHLNLLFARARTQWRDAAARIDPQLQPAGYKLLMYIARVGSANAHQLADAFEIDKSVVSRQVRMLEDFGLVESRADELDGRLRVLTATAKASAALAEIRGDHANRLRVVLDELTADEIVAASKVFRLLSEV